MRNVFRKILKTTAIAAVLLTGASLFAEEEFFLGGCAHFSKARADINATLDLLQAVGMNSVRDDIVWMQWEKARKQYVPVPYYEAMAKRAYSLGLRPLHLINWGHPLYDPEGVVLADNPNPPKEAISAYAEFAGWVASHYSGYGDKPRLYQVWNEWKGNPAPYTEVLAAAYPRIKKADPNCIVIANSCHKGIAFMEETFKLGMLENCDGFSWHGYNHAQLDERKRSAEAFFAEAMTMVELSKKYNHGRPKPLYITEAGRPTHLSRVGATEGEAADYITRVLLLVRTEPAIRGIWLYSMLDRGYDFKEQEDNFGLCRVDMTPKEPFYAVRSIAEIVRHGTFVRRWKTPADVWLLQYRMPDGRDVLAAWTTKPDVNKQLIISRGNAPKGSLLVWVAGGTPVERQWEWLELLDAAGGKFLGLGGRHSDEIAVTIGSRPVLLSGKLEGAELKTIKEISKPTWRRNSGTRLPETVILSAKSLETAQKHEFGSELLFRQTTSSLKRNGLSDVDANFRVANDSEKIYLEVTVTDDVHFNNYADDMLWSGDSVQAAFSVLNNDSAVSGGTEYMFALTEQGPRVFREVSQTGSTEPTGAKLEARRNGRETCYRISVPLKELGVKYAAGTPMGFSLVVNDNDGEGRKGYLHWADGIGTGKNPDLYNWVVLQ